MRNYKFKIVGLLSCLFILAGCSYDNIDPITKVDAGADSGNPQINISYPIEGTTIKVIDETTSIDIKFEVTDDIEVDNIEVLVDGTQVETMNEFTDYRIVKGKVTYDNLTNGDHTLTIKATDTAGNVTTKTVNFSKEPPYTPKFAGEIFYMPFDGDYTDLVTLKTADQVGDPGFTSDAFLGTAAYKGAPDSYITYPLTPDFLGQEFTAAFWYKVNGDPDHAGILVAGADQNRTQGFRLFREGTADSQQIKLNVGTGTGESWNDGGKLDVTAGDWVYITITVTPTETTIYFNGVPVNTAAMAAPIDWTGVNTLDIGSGGDTFSYWGHKYDSSPIDELRFFNKALTQEEIQGLISASAETLHMPFDGDYKDQVSNRDVTVVGNPGFAGEAKVGSDAYAGAADSYLTMPSEGLLTQEFSGTFWYKVNSDPDRAGIVVIGPEDSENPDAQNKRTSGFRLFREANGDKQQIKLNVGTGTGESWNDGGLVDPSADEWVFVAFTISKTQSVIYLNGEPVNTADLSAPIDWTGTDLVSIMSGAPRFTGWGHLSDTSYMDDLKFYNKTLSQEEVQAAMAQ
ncbi:MAG: LamG-like jellyroll fold domain-containing protein [Gillisia sp.]